MTVDFRPTGQGRHSPARQHLGFDDQPEIENPEIDDEIQDEVDENL